MSGIWNPGGSSGGGSLDVYEGGASTVSSATRLDFKDLNVESAGAGLADLYLDLAHTCQGRLTTQSGVPVSTSDRTSQGTVYFTPYRGGKVALYDGTRWKLHAFTERSLTLSGLTSGRNYDVFLRDNAGTLTLSLSLAWSGDNVTRGENLTTQDGVYVLSGFPTYRYLGTLRTTSATTTEDSAAKRFLWNEHNRVRRALKKLPTTDSWTYAVASWRQWNADAANQVEFVLGRSEEPVELVLVGSGLKTTGVSPGVTVGLDSTSAKAADTANGLIPILSSGSVGTVCRYQGYPGQGYHYLAFLENSRDTNTVTFHGDAGLPDVLQAGGHGIVWG